jgi:hypothetical protein
MAIIIAVVLQQSPAPVLEYPLECAQQAVADDLVRQEFRNTESLDQGTLTDSISSLYVS